jgi:hypothetical protein
MCSETLIKFSIAQIWAMDGYAKFGPARLPLGCTLDRSGRKSLAIPNCVGFAIRRSRSPGTSLSAGISHEKSEI